MLKNEGHNVIFIGTESGLEKDLIPKAGFDIKYIHASGLNSGLASKIHAVTDLNKGVTDCLKIIDEEKPDMCLGTGGYVTAPLLMAAVKRGIRSVIHESNALPGKTTKLMSNKIDKVLVGFNETKEKLSNGNNIVVTGNPNKMGQNTLTKEEAKNKIGINGKILLVFGGSQGAKKINDTLLEIIKNQKFNGFNVIYATGPKNFDEVKDAISSDCRDLYEIEIGEEEIILYPSSDSSSFTFVSSGSGVSKDIRTIDIHNHNKIIIKKFIYNMEEVMKASDLVVCRSGALTISEISEVGIASILIPFPYAAENHQYYNAKTLENVDAGVVIEEKDLTTDKLVNAINEIMKDDNKVLTMAENSKRIKQGDSPIENIKREIFNLL